jgi:hypothetical protein
MLACGVNVIGMTLQSYRRARLVVLKPHVHGQLPAERASLFAIPEPRPAA